MYRNILAFSRNGEYLAYSSPDGCLKIWETSTGILKQEFTPSSHLTATCTSIAWGPAKLRTKSPKKSKNELLHAFANLQLIAMGTLTGDVLLYSFTNAELHTLLTNGHTGAVNDLYWYHPTNSLFTCSNDQHIIEWEINASKIKTKWKADKVAVYSICVVNENHLLSAGTSIHLWDIKQKSVIKKFEGHSTEISKLLLSRGGSQTGYFLSAAIGDRIINAWPLNEDNNKRSVASFVSSDEPGNIDIYAKKTGSFKMSVVTKDGHFHLFEHTFIGKLKTPMSPKFSIQVASKPDSSSAKAYPIPILAANISEDLDACIIVYGMFIKPVFERINISDATSDLFLIRDLSTSAITIEESVLRIKVPEKSNNVRTLAPGHMTDITLKESPSKKRKPEDVDVAELSMEERLKALELSKTPKDLPEEEPSIKLDSMRHLLLQGLQSKDNDILNTVFQCGDKKIIRNTLQKLPIQSISLVLKQLYLRLNKQEPRNHPCSEWLTQLLSIHWPYLMSCKVKDVYIDPILQVIGAKTEKFSEMMRLQGGINSLYSQGKSSISNLKNPLAEPLEIYESESSDESEDEDDDDINISEDNSEEEVAHDMYEENESSSSESEMEI
ncbi:WD repeat-containing protein 43 [Caerostris darwini]|uniref:WD repeat-containing protein 43 n=1 Tax=Caerostris darwini TaxID=1538125 RepID=A0AAV4WQS4_9ARAC|nr:WD repeat-containing protein 43 [Caerostris darwini]